jgi:hypothetical protein
LMNKDWSSDWAIVIDEFGPALDEAVFARVKSCTPGYLNTGGAVDKLRKASLEVQIRMTKGEPWVKGFNDYARAIEQRRADWKPEDLEVRA